LASFVVYVFLVANNNNVLFVVKKIWLGLGLWLVVDIRSSGVTTDRPIVTDMPMH